jgi:hypothetical protein
LGGYEPVPTERHNPTSRTHQHQLHERRDERKQARVALEEVKRRVTNTKPIKKLQMPS